MLLQRFVSGLNAPKQDEAFHLLETPAEGSQDEFGWEEAGIAAGDQEEDAYGLPAYAVLELPASDAVRSCTKSMLCISVLHHVCGCKSLYQ